MPLPQGGPGSTARLLRGAVAMVLILGVTLTVFLLYRWQQRNQLGMDINGMDLSSAQKLEPLPDRQSQLAPEDIQSPSLKDSDVHYAKLDTSALELAPGPQTTVPGPPEVVEYATIQLSPPQC